MSSSALLAHIARIEAENVTERWALAPPGTFRRCYQGVGRSLHEPGWARVWCAAVGGKVIAHCSVVDCGLPDGWVAGHIGIERPHRSQGLARRLQALRFAFLDANGLTLVGPVAMGNDTSFHGCRRNGFLVSHHDAATGETWVYRPPGAKDERHARLLGHGRFD